MTLSPPRPSLPPFSIGSPKRAERYLKILIYGEYGAGKTTLAGSAIDVPQMQRCMYLDVEAGDLSVINRPDLDYVRVPDYATFARISEFLRRYCQLRDGNDLAGAAALRDRVISADAVKAPVNKPIRTVIIDSLSEIQKLAMYRLLGIRPTDESFALDNELIAPEFKEWNKDAEMIRLLVRVFRDLPMHVIFVSAASDQESKNALVPSMIRPALPGKLAREVQGFLDVVGFLQEATVQGDENKRPEIRRRLYLRRTKTFDAKHRFINSDLLWIDEPTMAKLYSESKIGETN